jgi:predicted RNA-binding protein (virulence factor B family)
MILAGQYHTLTVGRISPHGLYLVDDEGQEVLLPNRYVSLADKEGDRTEVFVYHDSENRLIATREHPVAIAGQAAFLEVVDKNIHGAFLAWGITAKDLFVPNANQTLRMEPGHRYVVFVYRDEVSGRVVATMRLNGFISNAALTVRVREEVELLVAQRIEAGFRVVVNDRHWGVIYDNQIFAPVNIGDRLTGYVSRITEDNRVDVSLQQQGFDQVKASADRLVELLRENGGRLPLTDASAPEEVAACTGMSKKVFKRTVGYLMKSGALLQGEDGVSLVSEL